MAKTRILLATNGSGYQLDKCLAVGSFKHAITAVVSDRACGALDVATRHGVESVDLSERDSVALNEKIRDAAVSRDIDYIVSPGFTRLFRGSVLDPYARRVFNCHPSLLPAFRGFYDTRDSRRSFHPRKIFERTLEFGARITGNTIHLVTSDVDEGYPVIVSSMHIPHGEDPVLTRHRLFVQECRCLLQLVSWLGQGRIAYDASGRPLVVAANYGEPWYSPNLDDPKAIEFDVALPRNLNPPASATPAEAMDGPNDGHHSQRAEHGEAS